jgi:hypothetical protein
MDIPSKHLDDTIAYSIETQTVVSTAQKQRAWEKLQSKAAQQVILAPYAVSPRTHSSRQPTLIASVVGYVRRVFDLLITDEAVYHRAASRRSMMHRMPYAVATISGTQQVARFHMSDILRYSVL